MAYFLIFLTAEGLSQEKADHGSRMRSTDPDTIILSSRSLIPFVCFLSPKVISQNA